MACGTGKTLAALFIKEKLAADRTLVLVPSLSLLKQTLREWTTNKTHDFEFRAVCSDDTVLDDDAAVSHASDLGLPATTSPEEIARFLRRRSGPRVVFATYQSSPQIAKAHELGRVPGFDLVVADEAHRCAGPTTSDFATILNPAKIKASRRLFMTATPRYFTGRIVREAKDADYEVASMDDEAKFGTVFHRLPFDEAIERDLLTDYQVAVVGVDDATYRDWAERGELVILDGSVKKTDARTLAGQIGLAKAMKKYDLRRTITFHSRVKRASEFARSMPEVIAWMPPRQRPRGTLWSDYASGQMSAGDREIRLRHLAVLDDGERGVLANARCLAEGVDVPTLDGVAFIDPRRSEVDIVQAVGRAIRRSNDKIVGTIVIPVFIDVDEDPEIALDDSVFKPVWDVIKALRSHDEELGEQLDELRRQLGRGRGKARIPAKIRFDLPATVDTDFADAFDVCLVENTTASWEFWFGMLEQYVAANGHARVPVNHSVGKYNLGSWANVQRYKKAVLAEARRERLEGLPGWAWDLREQLWSDSIAALGRFVTREGHARVRSDHVEDNVPLGEWVSTQRDRRDKLARERIARLESVPGWSWDHRGDRWAQCYTALKKYVDRTGDIRIPNGCVEDGINLYSWVGEQRANRESLSSHRRAQLEALPGWLWRVKSDAWDRNLALLRDFAEREGHARVRYGQFVQGVALGQWAKAQRTLKEELSPERRRQVEAVPGWTWDSSRAQLWNQRLKLLHKFVEREGHARVRFNHEEDGFALGHWVAGQRKKRQSMAAERRAQLESLPGWIWAHDRDESWDKNFELLQAFAEREGYARVQRRHREAAWTWGLGWLLRDSTGSA